jgi:amino acid transporter, AAT family
MLVMYLGWKILKRTKIVGLHEMDLDTDVYVITEEERLEELKEKTAQGRFKAVLRWIF